MTFLVDLLVILITAVAALGGYRRGVWLVVCELASVVLATFVALAVYHPAGAVLQQSFHLPRALANVAVFAVVWMVVELAFALIVRFAVVPHLARLGGHSIVTQSVAAILNAEKALVVVTLSLIVLSGSPIATGLKAPLTEAFLAQGLLTAGSGMQGIVMGLIGRDISDSLTVLTAPPGTADEKAVELGFKTHGSVDEPAEAQMIELVNQERTSRGLQALKVNSAAGAVARSYGQEILTTGYFSHIDQAGRSPFDRLRAAKVPYGAAGENLALSPGVSQAHQALMNSPGHRANILSPVYRTVGIGVLDAGQYGYIFVQDFTD